MNPRFHNLLTAVLMSFVAPMIGANSASADERYWALLRNGEQFSGAELDGRENSKIWLKLAGRSLMDRENPVRVLRDSGLSSQLAAPYVELTNGDVLPGSVLQWSDALPDGIPAHLIVQPRDWPAWFNWQPTNTRVRFASVKRIVQSDRSEMRFQPGLVRLKDGRRLSARAIRWSDAGLEVLTSDGVTEAALAELAEVHFLDRDVVAGVVGDSRWREIFPEGHLTRVQTTDGAQLTFPHTMTAKDLGAESRPNGRRQLPGYDNFFAVQPLWSLDPIYVPAGGVVERVIRGFDEVPLSLLPVSAEREVAGLHRWPWRRNQNVQGNALRCGQIAVQVGVGTHSYNELTFELPAGAREFETYVGLDRAAADGGCVECRVYADRLDGTPLWQSGYLRGSDGAVRVGPLPLTNVKRLILVTDFGHDGRPDGADPYDIRDHVNWLLPIVRIENRPADAAQDLAFWIPQLKGWKVSPESRGQIELLPQWEPESRRWEMSMKIGGSRGNDATELIVFERAVEVSLANAWLPIAARHDGGSQSKYEIGVRVDGSAHGSTMNGNLQFQQSRRDADSRVWIFSDFVGKRVSLSVNVSAAGEEKADKGGIIWQTMALRPLVDHLRADGKPIAPNVLLTSLEPAEHSLDRAARLQPGRLTDGRELTIRGFPFADGIGVPVGTELTYPLDPRWRQFVAVIGLADGWKGAGPYQILLDDELHWSSGVQSYGRNNQAEQIDVAIPAGHQTITLRVLGEDSFGAWASAGFMTK